jgi:hypothetical protein
MAQTMSVLIPSPLIPQSSGIFTTGGASLLSFMLMGQAHYHLDQHQPPTNTTPRSRRSQVPWEIMRAVGAQSHQQWLLLFKIGQYR